MKRMVLSTLTMLALTAGVAFAQGPNTTPPGPTQQQEPGLTSNNMPNPGSPQMEEGVGNQPVSTLQNEPEEGMDVDVDTGANAAGAVDVDVTRTSDADTDASGINETGESTSYGTDTDSLPATGSKLPLFGLMGLLALGAAFVVRRF